MNSHLELPDPDACAPESVHDQARMRVMKIETSTLLIDDHGAVICKLISVTGSEGGEFKHKTVSDRDRSGPSGL